MSRACSAALKAHLAQEVTTVARIWTCVLKNGTTQAFTDHDQDIPFNGVIYSSTAGFAASNVVTSSGLNVDNLEVTGMLLAPSVTEQTLLENLWDGAAVTFYLVNYADLTMGAMYLRSGTLGVVKIHRTGFTAELRGLTQPLQQNILEYFQPSCRAHLGDARCKVALGPFTAAGSVTTAISQKAWNDTSLTQTTATVQKAIATVPPGSFPAYPALLGITNANPAVVHAIGHGFSSGQQVSFSGVSGMTQINGVTGTVTYIDANTFSVNIDTSLISLPYPPGYAVGAFGIYTGGGLATLMPTSEYFQNGLVTFTSGANAGLSMEVKLYHIGYLELFQPMPFTVALGDTYNVSAGCDRQHQTCRDRFNNIINFRGEAFLPGNDSLLAHA